MKFPNTKKLSISLSAILFTMCFCFWLSGVYTTLTSAQTTACNTCGGAAAGTTDYLIFAMQTDNQSGAEGKNVEVSGNNNDFDGRVHSNGDFYVGGNQNTFLSAVTYEDQFFSQPSNTYPAGFPAQAPAQASYPGFLSGYTPPACMFGSLTGTTDIIINNSSPDGVYCNGPDKTIKISDANVTGSFTLISNGGFIDISGNSQTLTPYANNVLAYSTRASLSDDVIKVQGNQSNITGIFFAPNGQVFVSGETNVFCTQFVGQRVEVSGNNNEYSVLGTTGCNPATITIIKDVANGTSATNFSFTSTGGLTPANFTLDDDADPTLSDRITFNNVAAGVKTVTESDPAGSGFELLGATCDETGGIDNSTFDFASRTVTINAEAGETITCTFTNGLLVVTAATAAVSGRVTDYNGRALSKVKVFISDNNGVARQAISNSFGYYRFEDLPSGETYIIQGFHKKYSFEPVVISLAEDVSAPNLIGQ